MLKVGMDQKLDSIFIEFESGTAGYAEELDDNRIVDYSLNPGKPIGVCLHNVSNGVKLEGLPQPELVSGILTAFKVDVV
jgi:uncharacterized protein YuzE